MTKQERIRRKIETKEKIKLSISCESIKSLAIFISLTYIIIAVSVIYIEHLNFKSFALINIMLISYIFILLQFKKYVAASIIGEMLISESIFKKNKITSLRSIKDISTTSIFKYDITKVTYKLDGNTITIRFLNKVDSEHLKGEEIIKTVLKEAC